MLKFLFLQSWYNISDEELEFQCYDRLSFQQFLDYPKTIPDYSTIWRFREYLAETGITVPIWEELQRQIETHDIQVKEGVIQDACFITADPGKTQSGMENRGDDAKTSRNRDGPGPMNATVTVFFNGSQYFFGLLVYAKADNSIGMNPFTGFSAPYYTDTDYIKYLPPNTHTFLYLFIFGI